MPPEGLAFANLEPSPGDATSGEELQLIQEALDSGDAQKLLDAIKMCVRKEKQGEY